jgi:hypothetical protein
MAELSEVDRGIFGGTFFRLVLQVLQAEVDRSAAGSSCISRMAPFILCYSGALGGGPHGYENFVITYRYLLLKSARLML